MVEKLRMTSSFVHSPWLDRVFWFALALYLVVLPIGGTIAIRYLAFVALLAVTGAILLKARRIPELPFAPYWLAYFLVAMVSAFFAVDPHMSWSELRVEVLYLIAIFVVGVTWGRYLRDFTHVVMLIATINAILTFSAFQFVRMDMRFEEIRRIPAFAYAGMDGNWLLIVVFLACWLAWHAWKEGRRILPLLLVLLVVFDIWAMMATQNRQNLVALGTGVATAAMAILWQRFSWQRAGLFLIFLSLVAALITSQMLRRGGAVVAPGGTLPTVTSTADAGSILVTSAATDVRWDLWRYSLGKIVENPWLGGGIGRAVFDKLHSEYRPEIKDLWHAHNMLLNKGIQMGIPGMLAFLMLWIALGVELLRHIRARSASSALATAGLAVIAAIFMKNMSDDYFVRNVALVFWLMLGLLIGSLRSARED